MKARFPWMALILPILACGIASAADPPTPAVNYTYYAKVVRVIDGGTVALDVDLGFGVWMHNQVFRLQGVAAPALDGPDKEAALQWKTKAQQLLSPGAEVLLQSIKDKSDKSGLYHAVLWLDNTNVNEKIAR